MKVYALVGKSGTGKSFQAANLCGQMNIEYIIDDGLLIGGATVLAGVSAKRQQSRIGAIKTALFTSDAHRDAVLRKLSELSPESLLVIGTSDAMIEKIRARLDLPELERTIYVEEITTEEERRIADRQRREQGQHVIPVPTLQLKKEFSGYFMNPLRRFMGRGSKAAVERTVVRPTYSYLGDYHISDRVIVDIVGHICAESPAVHKVSKINVYKANDGIKIGVSLIMKYGEGILTAAENLQRKTAMVTEGMTAFNIEAVDIEIRGLK